MTEEVVVPLKGVRGMIAKRMVESARTTAQAVLFTKADAGALLARRAKLKSQGSAATVEDILLYAISRSLIAHPSMNGTLKDNEIRLRSSVDLGVAIAVDTGLVVPAISDCGNKSIEQISVARRDLLARARSGKLTVGEMTGGSFSVSNLGHFPVDHFTPVINIPQLAILGVGRIVQEPMAGENGKIVLAPSISLSLSIDHRAVDGAPAAAFLEDLCIRIRTA